jgi:low affinity Fe/Cu permease
LSRVLHRVVEQVARAATTVVVALAVAAFVVVAGINGFPSGWEAAFSLVSSAITLVMVFTIQHTQTRQQIAIQLKLDELIRSSPQADDLLVHIESAAEDELVEMEQTQLEHHVAMRSADDDAGGELERSDPVGGEERRRAGRGPQGQP